MRRVTEGRGEYPVTPDGRYFVVRGRLWRRTNPKLGAEERERLVGELMRARSAVDAAKVALGERGPVWWSDGAKDWNRTMVKNSPYAAWFAGLEGGAG